MSLIGVALAAGASTRMKSKKSKLLHDLMGRPLVLRALDLMNSMTDQPPLFVLGHQRDEILKELSEAQTAFEHCIQEQQKGTADAVAQAVSALEAHPDKETHVFIMPADAVLFREESLLEFCRVHRETKSQLSFISCELDEPAAYGRVIRDTQGRPQKIVEFKNANDSERKVREVNSGIYLVRLDLLKSALKEIQANKLTGEFYFTDIVEFLYKQSGLVQAHVLKDASECLGVNTQNDLALARKLLRLRINSKWMQEGVEMMDPDSVSIDSSVTLSAGVCLHPGVVLRGATKLEEMSEVGAYSVIINSKVGPSSIIKEHCVLERAQVGSSCTVGPFARLRPGTDLSENVKIGNFVESKNSKFEAGSKANHLSYVGDSEVGQGSNIGAGTITCNYDGYSKSKTILGQNVFVGSNSSLVAPVEIEDGAIIGAGSVITKQVSQDAIAVTRAEQKELPGAAKRFREKREKKV